MAYERGGDSVEVELARTQGWIEVADLDLYGRNGSDLGVIREWRDFKSKQVAFQTFMKVGVSFVGLLAAFVTILVGLSAVGIVHLR